jgi:hypothetical protein
MDLGYVGGTLDLRYGARYGPKVKDLAIGFDAWSLSQYFDLALGLMYVD